MLAVVSKLKAQPGKEQQVQQALEEMVDAARALDPPSKAYMVHRSEDDPAAFLIYEEHEDAGSHSRYAEDEELLKLGTALRESLMGPIEIESYSLLRAL